VVTQPIHEGLIAALRDQVIPRLLADAPARIPIREDFLTILGWEASFMP
jgi:hypothetical protein